MSEYIIDTEQIKGITPYLLAAKTIPSWLACWALWDVSGAVPQRKDDGVAIGLPEIVRCRDCKYYESVPEDSGDWCGYWTDRIYVDASGSGFCAWGERKEGSNG